MDPAAISDVGAHAPAGTALSGRQKAAIVVQLMLSGGTRLSLSDLSENAQAELILQMARLRRIDKATLQGVAQEFVEILEAGGLNFPGALEGTLNLLEGQISGTTANRLRRQAGLSRNGDPWKRVGDVDGDQLVEIVRDESVEVAAVILAKLKVSKAAEILGLLPGDQARRIAYTMSLTDAIAPDMVQKIGHSIAAQLDAQPISAFEHSPVERVGAILNFSPSTTREDVLHGLEQEDSGFAAEVRKAIFTFGNIPERIDPRDVPKIIRDVSPEDLVTALAGAKGADEAPKDFILNNMSQRMADQLREEIESRGQVKESEVETAMNAVVATIRNLEAAGDIFLVAEDD